jgi:trk system potassium uptake protein TrkH
MFFMLVGGCAGSTSGGIKYMRVGILARVIHQELFRLSHPRSVSHIKVKDQIISREVVSGVGCFFIIYMLLLLLFTIALSAFNIDLFTAFSATLSSLSNIGPGFGIIGPSGSYADFPSVAKLLLALCMLLGRLEVYAILLLVFPEFWRK